VLNRPIVQDPLFCLMSMPRVGMAASRCAGSIRTARVAPASRCGRAACNHPSQWLGDGAWAEADSGKFARLRELLEEIAAKQEKVLVFTQFRETTAPLAAFLGSIFGREGLVLHGGTPVVKRRELVKRFQEDEQTPFFVDGVFWLEIRQPFRLSTLDNRCFHYVQC